MRKFPTDKYQQLGQLAKVTENPHKLSWLDSAVVQWYPRLCGADIHMWVCCGRLGEERSDAWPWVCEKPTLFTQTTIFPVGVRPQVLPKKTARTVVFLWEGSPEGPRATALLSWRALGT